jgi:hypothetical protein
MPEDKLLLPAMLHFDIELCSEVLVFIDEEI